jgi:transcriptional regulator GlxA family with amidase domain
LGRTVLEEIQANRLRLARTLLEETDLPVSKIFPRCGFMTHQIFYSIFKAQAGLTPQQYREKYTRGAV